MSALRLLCKRVLHVSGVSFKRLVGSWRQEDLQGTPRQQLVFCRARTELELPGWLTSLRTRGATVTLNVAERLPSQTSRD